jgi:hypothetical protein
VKGCGSACDIHHARALIKVVAFALLSGQPCAVACRAGVEGVCRPRKQRVSGNTFDCVPSIQLASPPTRPKRVDASRGLRGATCLALTSVRFFSCCRTATFVPSGCVCTRPDAGPTYIASERERPRYSFVAQLRPHKTAARCSTEGKGTGGDATEGLTPRTVSHWHLRTEVMAPRPPASPAQRTIGGVIGVGVW